MKCNKCGKILEALDNQLDTEPIKTDQMEINAVLIKPCNYCCKCHYQMRAEAGLAYWENYKDKSPKRTQLVDMFDHAFTLDYLRQTVNKEEGE